MTQFDRVIPPGSEGKIFAKIDTSHSEGAVQKFIDIKSNDPVTPLTKVSIKAVIKSLVNATPEYVRFDALKGSLLSEDVILTAQPSVKILKATTDSPLISAELVPQKGGKYKLTVHMQKSEIIGTQATEVKLALEGPIKEMKVPVVMVVHGPLQPNPPVVSFQLNSFPEMVTPNSASGLRIEANTSSKIQQKVAPGDQLQVLGEGNGWYHVFALPKDGKNPTNESFTEPGWIQMSATKAVKPPEFPEPQQIQIQSSGKKPFQVLDLKSTLPVVKVDRKAKAQASSLFEFTVTLQKVQNVKKQNLQGEIIVRTDNPDQPEVRIPLYVIYG